VTAAIELSGVAKEYPGSPPVAALRDVDLSIDEGELVALVGPSGSGKSTLLHLIGTLDRPTAGIVRVAGHDVASMSDRRLSMLRADAIGFVFQQFFLIGGESALDNVADGLLYRGVRGRARREAAAAALERVGLGHRVRHRPAQLSGGERQRVAIARAIAFRPALLVCDEPVSALDVSVQAQILNLLRAIRQETQIAYLFITHDLAVVRQIADRVHVLHRGEIVESGATQNVLDAPQHPYTRRLIASIPGAGRPDYNGVSLT
jgi:putative ABC transport system ATP-binding protein